ncbi:MAG: DUF5995 family protein [Gaiellaceae bacterium]
MTVRDVIDKLHAIESASPASNGIACFARLYREVTEGVNAELEHRTLADARFVTQVDVCFAGLFFSAFDAHQRNPGTEPPAWRPLFEGQAAHGVAPLQFALAGMNAHINRDLPVALVTTCRELSLDLSESTPEHADFVRINALLAHVEQKIKRSYVTGWLATVDRLVHRFDRIDDVVAMWDVARARDAAWTNAQALWALHGDAALESEFLATLDSMVGLASRGLLIPADSLLQKLGRRLKL